MLWLTIILYSFWIAEWPLANGLARPVSSISRKFIRQAGEDVVMEAYYQDIDLSAIQFNVSWLYENEKIEKNSRENFRFENNGTRLQITKVIVKDTGTYTCNITTQLDETYLTIFKLVVRKEPLPLWAIILIIVGLLLLLVGTWIYFKYRRNITDIMIKHRPRRKRKTVSETSFQE